MHEEQFTTQRQEMAQLIALYAHHAREELGKDQLDSRVFEAIGKVPRHEFVPEEVRPYAYHDGPLPIGFGKTISQPFMMALMTDLLDLGTDDAVLEIGTGLGYHAAVLSELSAMVFSVEIVEELAIVAEQNLARLSYGNVHIRVGDGSRGWPEHGPFDKVVLTAGVELIPPTLLQQLRPGGKMVLPAGTIDAQQLTLVEKDADDKISTRSLLPVRFAPLERSH